MSLFICKRLSTHLRLCTTFPPIKNLLHFTSSALDNSSTQESFTVSYLTNSCGLTAKHALLASKRFNLKNPENADSVIALFKKHGFSDAQISKTVQRSPNVLSRDCENVILPKLEFFTSIGFSSTALANFIAASPHILGRSLVNSLIPTWNFLKSVLKTNETTIKVVRRVFQFMQGSDSEARVTANIEILRELGVSESTIMSFLQTDPFMLLIASDKFKVTVEKVKQMGFNPDKFHFLVAISVVASLKKSTWEKKVEICKKWGWSEDDVYFVFVKCPRFMRLSKHKMSSIMDMVVNKSGFDPSDVFNWPVCLQYSFEKRVVPRCLFYQDLMKRGLIRKKWSLFVLVGYADTQFMKKIMKCYPEAAPELLKLYKSKKIQSY